MLLSENALKLCKLILFLYKERFLFLVVLKYLFLICILTLIDKNMNFRDNVLQSQSLQHFEILCFCKKKKSKLNFLITMHSH